MPDKHTSSHSELSTVQSIASLESLFSELRKRSFGMPLNQDKPDLSDLGLSGLAMHTINNLGDPYKEGCYQIQSKAYEREVIDYVASLYHLTEDAWGYVTNCGSEGNLFAIYLAREILRSQVNHGMEPLLVFSSASHYSMPKAARVLDIESRVIECDASGEMNYRDLVQALQQYSNRPLIMVLNIGTTLTGASDNLDRIKTILAEQQVKNYFIHCDAALSGMMLPFMDVELPVSFSKGIDSIVISAHKFLGSPIPSGMVVTRKQYADQINNAIEVIGSTDITMGGSRYGLPAIVAWYILQQKKSGIKQEVQLCLDNARYLHELLQDLDYPSFINPASVTVVFRKPRSTELIERYQLAVVGEWAHVVVLQHITHNMITLFVSELMESELQPQQVQQQVK